MRTKDVNLEQKKRTHMLSDTCWIVFEQTKETDKYTKMILQQTFQKLII